SLTGALARPHLNADSSGRASFGQATAKNFLPRKFLKRASPKRSKAMQPAPAPLALRPVPVLLPRTAAAEYALARLGRNFSAVRATVQRRRPSRVGRQIRVELLIPDRHEVHDLARAALLAPAVAARGDAGALLAIDDFHRAEHRAHLEVVVLGEDLRFDAGPPA